MTTQLAMALCEAGRPAEALKVLRPYGTSRDPDTLNALGIAASDAGRREQAIAAFRRALDSDPTNVPAHQNLGIAYLKADDAARARTELEAAVAANDGLATAWNALGVARARLGDADGALAAWKKAYETQPSFLDALLNYGLLASRTGRTAEARTALGDLLARSRDPEQRRQAEAALRGLGAAR
jgi:tetratricopeptide (TPR) repeat protein